MVHGFNSTREDLQRMKTHTWVGEGPKEAGMARCTSCELLVMNDFFVMNNLPPCPGPDYMLFDRRAIYAPTDYKPKHRKESHVENFLDHVYTRMKAAGISVAEIGTYQTFVQDCYGVAQKDLSL